MIEDLIPKFTEWFREPRHPGAIAGFREAWAQGKRLPSIMAWAGRNAGWLFLFSVILISRLPHQEEFTPQITTWIWFYLIYLVALELFAARWPASYDAAALKFVRIQANIFMISALIAHSSGLYSYFWFFYGLPIFATAIHFRRGLPSLLIYLQILVFWFLAIEIAPSGSLFDPPLFVMDSAALLFFMLVLHYISTFHAEATREYAFQLMTLNEANRVLSGTRDRESALNWSRTYIRKLIDVEHVATILFDVETFESNWRITSGSMVDTVAGPEMVPERGVLGEVMNKKQALVVPNANAFPGWDPRVDDPTGHAVSVVCAPLLLRGEAIGAISAINRRVGEFTPNDLNLLSSIASSTGIALENIQLTQVGSEVGATLDLEQVLGQVCVQVTRLLKADSFYIALYDQANSTITIDPWICRGVKQNRLTLQFGQNSSFAQYIIESGQVIHINNWEAESSHLPVQGILLGDPTRSWLGVPLHIGPKMIGAISVQSDRNEAFDAKDRRALELVADQVVIAIENAKLHQKVSNRSQQLDLLDKIILEIGSTSDTAGLLQTIIHKSVSLLDASGGGIYLLNEDGRFCLAAVSGLPSSLEGQTFDQAQGITGLVCATRQPKAIPNYREWQKRLQILDKYDLTSVAAAPILASDQVLGAIVVHDLRTQREFDQEDLDLLLRVANHAAVAIEKRRALAERSKRLDEIQTLYEEREAIYQASHALGSVLDYHVLLDRILDGLTVNLKYESCAILLKDVATDELTIVQARNYPNEVMEGTRIRIGGEKGVAGWVAQTGEAAILPDVRLDPRYIAGIPGGRSEICVPLKTSSRIIGVLDVESTAVDKFGERDRRVLTSMAATIAMAIENARLFEKTNRTVAELAALSRVGLEITSGRDAALDAIVDSTLQLMNANDVHIMLYDNATDSFSLARARWASGESRQPFMPRKNGVTSRAVHSRQAQIIEDVEHHELFAKPNDRMSGLRSIASLPIIRGDSVLGALNVAFKEQHPFDKEERQMLASLASQAAIAIENARLYDELVKKTEALEDRTEELSLLLDLVNSILNSPGIEEGLEVVAQTMVTACETTFCEILLAGRDRQSLEVQAAQAITRLIPLKWDPALGSTCTFAESADLELLTRATEPVVFRREHTPDHWMLDHLTSKLSLAQPVESAMVIPLRAGSSFLGLCVLGEMRNGKRSEFRANSKRWNLALGIAAHAAMAVERARGLELAIARNTALTRVNAIGTQLASMLEIEPLLNSIVQSGAELLKAEVCSLFLVRNKGQLTLEASHGSPPGAFRRGFVLEIKDGLHTGLTGSVAACGKLLNLHGSDLVHHTAVRDSGPHDHLPSGVCSSLLAIPLKHSSGDEVIGLVKVENKKNRMGKADPAVGFDQEDVLLLQILASHAVAAIENAQLFALSNALQKVNTDVSATLDLHQVYRRVLSNLKGIIPFETASLQLLTSQGLRIVACAGFTPEDEAKVLQITFPLESRFPNNRVINDRKPFLISDIGASGYLHFWDQAKVFYSGHIKSWLGVPLTQGEQVLGMLSIDSSRTFRYDPVHIELATAFASQVAPAIVNARLLTSAKNLLKTGAAITQQRELGGVLQNIVNGLIDAEGLGADIAVIYPYDALSDEFQSPVHAGKLRHPEEMTPPESEASVVRRILRCQDPHITSDADGDELLDRNFVDREFVRSAAAFPLLIGSEPFGVMFVNFLSRHIFDESEKDLLTLFAQLATIAIHNARHYQAMVSRLQTATAAARVGRLASLWAHEVQTPTLGIRTEVATLLGRRLNELTKQALNRIDAYAIKIADTIPSLPRRHEAGPVELARVFDEVMKEVKPDLDRHGVHVRSNLEELPPVYGNPGWFAFMLSGLTRNAMRFTPDRGTLAFEGRVNGQRLWLDIVDSGPGVSDEIRNQLFKEQVADPKSEGRGYGLLLIKNALNDYDGDIGMPMRDERGNYFRLNLRLASEETLHEQA